jgi:hypothetical protein
MSKRRGRGEGGLHWDEKRQRWIASATVGYHPGTGKRVVRQGSGKTKTEARNKLKEKYSAITRMVSRSPRATTPLPTA